MVPVVTCGHACGHRCGGGCGQCGGATACVQYRPVTTCVEQQVAVTRPVVRHVPETITGPAPAHDLHPGQGDGPGAADEGRDRIPIPIVQCVTTIEMQPYEVTVTEIVPKRVTE